MATFITRVELHSATYHDYANLHAYMAQQGFTTTIHADNGVAYQLPPAEYHLIGEFTPAQALEKAKLAAQRTQKTFGVIVASYTMATWHGLSTAQQRAAV